MSEAQEAHDDIVSQGFDDLEKELNVVPGFSEQFTPIGIHHACFGIAERIFVASFDKETGNTKIKPERAVRLAVAIFNASFNYEEVRKHFAEFSTSANIPNIFEISIKADEIRRLEESQGQIP